LDVLVFLNEKMSSYTPLLIKSQEKKSKLIKNRMITRVDLLF
jgi:hypothetical protein